jgi:hypothetical protein
VALTVVHLVLRDTYWNSEEGTYALTARLVLEGHALYRQTVAAQPPSVYFVGAGLLWIHDSLEWLRLGVAALQLAAGLFAGQIVWRITRNVATSVLTPAAMLLTPWAVQEHGALTPELVSLPLLLGALLACRRSSTLPVTGVLCGLLPLVKVPDALPALVIILCSTEVRRTAAYATITLLLGLVGAFVLGGDALWREVVVAQTQSGFHSLGAIKGWFAQVAWNLSGLVLCCVLAWRFRARANDAGQLRAVLMTSVAALVTLLSELKNGTGLNVAVPVEAVLLPGAMCGVALAWPTAARARRSHLLTAGVAVLVLIFTLAQSISLLVSPTDPEPFLRAASARVGWAVGLTRAELAAAVRAARACPRGSVFGGPPFIAFVAGRRVPDDQPDGFITATPVLHNVHERMLDARDVCG